MNAELLLDAFNRLGDTPETVQQIRKIVVGLAMSGRLESSIEPALTTAKLLEQIEAGKRTSSKKAMLCKQEPLKNYSLEQIPSGFNITSNFARLGEVARIEKGQTSITKAAPGPYPLVVTAEERKSCNHFDFDGCAAIVPLVSSAGHGKASLQRLHYQEGKFALGSILVAIFPHAPELLSARFLFEYLTAFKDELLVSRMIGTANVSLSVGKIFDVPVPIIAPLVQLKVDDLMGLCDRLEATRADRETVRDRLTAASLARLNAPETAVSTAAASASSPQSNASPQTPSPGSDASCAFPDHARFVLDALPSLTARPDQIRALRQTILNLAVRGKLVPQDARDESTLDHLLELAEVPTKARKQLKPLNPADCGGDLPHAWIWLPLGAIIQSMDAGWSPQCENHPRITEREWGVLKTTAVQALVFQPSQHKLLSEKLNPRPDIQAEIGDILVTRAGPKNRVGVSCVVDVPCPRLMISDKIIRFHALGDLSPRYVALTLNAGFTLSQIEGAKSGMAVMQMNISQDKLRAIAIPLPPVAEQHRIVAKVDALMALCDKLEAGLTTAADTRRRLLDALLAEALAPDGDRLLEAAE